MFSPNFKKICCIFAENKRLKTRGCLNSLTRPFSFLLLVFVVVSIFEQTNILTINHLVIYILIL